MAQTQLYTKKDQVFVIEETTQDQYLVQTAASGFLAEIPDAPYTITSENYVQTSVRGDFLSNDEIPGMATISTTFRVPLKGGGTAGTAPEWTEAMKACGYRETADPGVDVVYEPLGVFDGASGNPGPSYSVTVVEDGVSYRIQGAFGNAVFNGQVGEPAFIEMTFTGAIPNAAQGAFADDALETITYETTVVQPFLGATFAINFGGAVTPKGISNLTIDTGNQVVGVTDVNHESGLYGSRITGRMPTVTFDPEMVLEATSNSGFRTLWRAGTTGTITTGVVGGTAGNKYQLDVGRCVLRAPEFTDRDGIRAVNLTGAISSGPNDVEGTTPEITLTLT